MCIFPWCCQVLSLVQQLGSSLAEETDMKMVWLQHALHSLNVKDQMVAAHVGGILNQLNGNLGSVRYVPLLLDACNV